MCIRRTFFCVVGKFVPFSFTTAKANQKKPQKTKNDKLGDGKKFGHELIKDETKNIYKKTKLFKGSGVMVIRSKVI